MINNTEQLFKALGEKGISISDAEKKEIEEVSKKYPVRISDHYFNLIDWNDDNCPIRQQCIPNIKELEKVKGYKEDPLNEGKFEKTPFLIHKYYSRAAFMCSNSCYMLCRHCTRKNTVMSGKPASKDVLPAALDYLKKHPEVNDILITGGDPLAISRDLLEYFIQGFRSVPTVNTIRIGTRAIVTEPDIITDELCDMLAKYRPLWIFTQFNHPKEVTKEAIEAANRIQMRGIPVGDQSVFMRGINDDADILVELYTKLIGASIIPYYLYICDRVDGTAHFYADYKKGMEIVEKLRYRLPGYGVPKLIIDADGENGGKVPISINHIICENRDFIELSGNKEGTTTRYDI
ncbi:KamA family radical SAM protein [Butyrivibrio sp. AC2005]|uniref:KamA family radical SAM protein n=1 Tax=Butyrivibrio sp. AC2005 TaxID=1280672 RepID=UPI000421FE92|nr:KamA family radical SAM protein [Butyrivibrio sp. AC2005]